MPLTNKFQIIIPPQDIACNPECILRLANGDREAFAWVYKNYSKRIYDYTLLLTGNETISEDIVQDVFLKLWQHREKLNTVENFNSYLYALSRNYIRDEMKDAQKEMSGKQAYYHDAVTFNMSVNETLDYKEAEQIIGKAVKQLPGQRQLVYRLSRESGLKKDQIAREMKLAPNTVRVHLVLALRFLRKKLST